MFSVAFAGYGTVLVRSSTADKPHKNTGASSTTRYKHITE